MPRIFISYRREDSEGHTGRLFDALAGRFGDEQVFIDIDTIPLGVDFTRVIEEAVSSCDVLIAVIGPRWLSLSDESGRKRLDNPEDFVRLEIKAALERDVRVIPALVQNAQMPASDQLPSDLTALARRNGISLRADSWHHSVARLIRAIEDVGRDEGAQRRSAAREPQESRTGDGAPRAADDVRALSSGSDSKVISERADAERTRLAGAFALAGAVAVLISFMLPLADGEFVLTYVFRPDWAPFFVYSPIELVPAALAAMGIGLAVLRDRISGALAGGLLLGGVVVVASAIALLVYFGVDALAFIPLIGGTLLVSSGALLAAQSRRTVPSVRRDTVTLLLAGTGAVAVFVSIFVEYEEGTSMANVGIEYALEPLVAAGSITFALLLLAGLSRPLVAAGLLLAVGVLTALRDVGVIVASAVGGSPLRTAGFIGLAGGVLAAAAGARTYRSSTSSPAGPRSSGAPRGAGSDFRHETL